jgi:putative aldouronate transport system permease protein
MIERAAILTEAPEASRAVRPPARPAWQEAPSVPAQVASTGALTLVVLMVLLPMWSIVVTSLASRETIHLTGGMVVIPRELDLSAYVTIFSGGQVTRALGVSLLVTLVGTGLSLVLTVLAAYGLSRPSTFGHRPLLFYFLLTFLIYPGLVPSYLVVSGLGLKDNLWSLILPNAVSVFNLVVLRSFFMAIPSELFDCARLDGANEWTVLFRVVLPLSRAVIGVVGLFYAVGYWNAYFNAVLYIDDNDLWPIQRVLQSYILAGQAPQLSGVSLPGFNAHPPTLAVKMAVVVVTVLPALLIYPFVQKNFTKGMLVGAVKG